MVKLKVTKTDIIPNSVINVVGQQLKRGKRYFGSSGASLTYQASTTYENSELENFSTKQVQIGLDGERKTTTILKKWSEDKPNVVLIDSIHLEGMGKQEEKIIEDGIVQGGDTDHILCFGHTVLMIDSKAWAPKKGYKVIENGEVYRSNKPFPGGKVNIVRAGHLWRNALKDFNVNLYSFICITDNNVFVLRDRNWWKQPYKLLSYDNLEEWLNKIWNEYTPEEDKEFIDVALVAYAAMNCVEPYDEVKELMPNIAHLLRS